MNICFDAPKSCGTDRVLTNLVKYLPPNFTIVDDPLLADLTIVHVVGRHDHVTQRVQKIKNAGHQYAIIQYVLQSCRNPDPNDWLELWNGAKVVWSYYDLKNYIPNIYHAPLAADSNIFYKENNIEKKYLVGTNSDNYKTECIGEIGLAAYGAKGKVVHFGTHFGSDPNVDDVGIVKDDNALRAVYNSCKWFSALRRYDGFEIIALEALLCGVRPIMFDTPNYRQWFNGLAEFIPEVSAGEVTRILRGVFRKEPRLVTDNEISEIKLKFNWEKIIKGFWERCLS